MPARSQRSNSVTAAAAGKVRGEGDTRDKSVYPCDDKEGRIEQMGRSGKGEGRRAVLFFRP